jgi:hypothetical protein
LTAVNLRRSAQEKVEQPDGAETFDEAAIERAREQRIEGTVNEEIYVGVPSSNLVEIRFGRSADRTAPHINVTGCSAQCVAAVSGAVSRFEIRLPSRRREEFQWR